MPIYTNDPCHDGAIPFGTPLVSSIGINPKVTKAIDSATKDWLDNHPEATTTVEDDSLTNAKLKDDSVSNRNLQSGSVDTDEIVDGAVTTSKLADNAVTAQKISNGAADGLRTMSTTQPGVAKVGAGLAINNGALELNGGNIAPAVTAWLNAHPEATTTVQDNSLTTAKYRNGSVTDAKLAQTGGILSKVDMLGILGTNKFTVEAGSGHSTLVDYIGGLGISAGDTFTMTIRQSNPKSINVYAFAVDPPVSGGGTNIHWDNQMAEESFDITAESDIESIGIYQAAASADNTIEVIVYDSKPPYLYLDIDLPTPHAQHLPAGTYDLNSFYEYGYYSFSPSATFTNTPFDFAELAAGVCTLDVYEIGTNKAGYQILRNFGSNSMWMRYFTGNHAAFTAWSGYPLTHGANSKVISVPSDFNDFTVADSYMIGTNADHLNSPDVMAMCWLEVTTRQDGVVNQLACYPRNGELYVRQRSKTNVWSEWFDLAPNSGGLLTVNFTVPMPNRLTFKSSIARNSGNIQDIAVYDGHVFDFGTGVMSVDGGTDVEITNGHGNNCNFGTELHGDFPYLYCGSWNMSDCNVYVNQVTATSATLVRTIAFPTLTGHLNSVVDESGDRIYILLNKSQATDITTAGDIDFIVASLSDGTIVSRTELPFAIPVIQGMDYVNGAIYVAHGGAGGYTENHIMMLDTSGRMLANTADITQFTEIEGLAFDGGKMYVANGATIYH